MATTDFAPGNYKFIPYAFQYSSGVAALLGYQVLRVQLRAPLPLRQGFERIEATIREHKRPLTAFCACELRSPGQFTEQGFYDFNKQYVVTLEKWGVFDGKTNPVARSNVCPEIGGPSEPSLHAFSFTVPADSVSPSFVIAGGAEARGGSAPYRERIVRWGESSTDALREKAAFVVAEMARRLDAFGFAWADTTATQVYTVHDFHPFIGDVLVRPGAARAGIEWHYARPPVEKLEFEMDCRSIAREIAI